MIKLVNPEWDNRLFLYPEVITVLIVEHQTKFYEYALDLCGQSGGAAGRMMFSDKLNILSLEKEVELITDLADFKINNKKITGAILKALQSIAQESGFLHDFARVNADLQSIFYDLADRSGLPLVFEDELDSGALIKGAGFHLSEEYATLVEKLACYVDILVQTKKTKVLILFFAKAYLTKDQLAELHMQCGYQGVSLLLLESNYDGVPQANEQILIIDKDLCEIPIQIRHSEL